MPPHAAPTRTPVLLVAAALSLAAGCSTPASVEARPGAPAGTPAPPSTTGTATAPVLDVTGFPRRGASSGSGAATPDVSATPTAAAGSSRHTAEGSCSARIVEGLTPEQRVGQLVMVGIARGREDDARRAIAEHSIGNAFYIGGWRDRGQVAEVSRRMQNAADASGHGLDLLVAADQEGGQVQQLRGEGFRPLPSAVEQAALPPDELRALATDAGRELRAAGVNLNLAPVADTVSPELGRANAPIGGLSRQFATEPGAVSTPVSAVVAGLHAAGVGATLKHFPGLGRVRANTDHSATGIDDTRTTADDAYLQPFADGIAAGADVVMMSTARYRRIDPATQAAFSRPVVTGVLRERLGYDGVVATDDLGGAEAIQHVPTGERAVRLVRAGGDVAVTGIARDGRVMSRALLAESRRDPAFAELVRRAVQRVVELKVRRGLARCG